LGLVKKSETCFVKGRENAMHCHSIVRVGLTAFVLTAPAATGWAQEFMLQVGPPIAGQAQPAKGSLLVVRPAGCADLASAQISATAEGLVDGTRRSVPLKLAPLPKAGVHAVPKEWPKGGVWIVSLVGTCADKTVGAIVAVGSSFDYKRQSVKLLGHRPTAAEIDASLKALTSGGQQ
jgi:hypothetical protein